MARSAMAGWEERFDDYVERLGDVLGHADRRAPLRAYTTGLLLPGEREGVEARGGRGACRGGAPRRSAPGQPSLPVAYRLYLPEAWAADPARRALAGVPEEVGFATKPEIALGQIRQALADGVPPGAVVTDAGYGDDTDFRDGITAAGLPYVAGILGTTSLWPPGAGPLPAGRWSGGGRPPMRLRRAAPHQPLAPERLAAGLPADAWRSVTWREGTAGELSSRFAAVRVRPAHGDFRLGEPRAEEWFLAEGPEGEKEPTKYWLSTLPEAATLEELVAIAKLRWRIERDFEELKQELGLGHFEGRGWRGFHHHAALCIAAYGFLVAERCRFSP